MVQRSKKAEARCVMCLITVAGYVMNFCLDIGHYAASKHTKQNKSHLMIKQEVSPSLETSHFAMFAVKRISALVSGGGTVNHLTGSLVTN